MAYYAGDAEVLSATGARLEQVRVWLREPLAFATRTSPPTGRMTALGDAAFGAWLTPWRAGERVVTLRLRDGRGGPIQCAAPRVAPPSAPGQPASPPLSAMFLCRGWHL